MLQATYSKRTVSDRPLFTAVARLDHTIPLMIALASLVGRGVLDRFPNLQARFFEGSAA